MGPGRRILSLAHRPPRSISRPARLRHARGPREAQRGNFGGLTSPEEPEWMVAETSAQVPTRSWAVCASARACATVIAVVRACDRDRGGKSQRSDPADDAGHGRPLKRGVGNAPQWACYSPTLLNISFAVREPRLGHRLRDGARPTTPRPPQRVRRRSAPARPLIHDEAALPRPQVEEGNSRPLGFTPIRAGLRGRAGLIHPAQSARECGRFRGCWEAMTAL